MGLVSELPIWRRSGGVVGEPGKLADRLIDCRPAGTSHGTMMADHHGKKARVCDPLKSRQVLCGTP